MKRASILALILSIVLISNNTRAQTTTPAANNTNSNSYTEEFKQLSDTITFTPYVSGTVMTNQYQNQGVVFSGYSGSTDPIVFDFSPDPLGKALHSDNWFNALRVNFVDTANVSQYQLAEKIEFDNPVSNEVDYMSIDIYNSTNTLIRHYLSTSPEHVFIDFGIPSAAYMTIDDSASTSFIIDNILIDFGTTAQINEFAESDFLVFPNPCNDYITIISPEKTTVEILNLEGQIINTINSNKKETIIDLGYLSCGVYVVRLKTDKETMTKKIIKE
jgi:hypothetical protein